MDVFVSILGRKLAFAFFMLAAILVTFSACSPVGLLSPTTRTVPRSGDWGIYEMDMVSLSVKLVCSTQDEIYSSALRLNSAGDRLVFAKKVNGTADSDIEIFSIGVDGDNLTKITDNAFWDLYPVWSPDGGRIAFLSKREKDLDIYVMDADGSSVQRLFDSGFHDADVDWADDTIVYTSQFAIWRMDADGTHAARVTDPPGRGEWGKANLPKGDYDPRLSRDGKKIVFERLEDSGNPNGGYNLFSVKPDGTEETRLTDNSYSQGIANWSNLGDKIIYVVAAMEGEGKYDMYVINADGTDNHNVTPSYFPPDFLCYSPVFSDDDSSVFFIGQWWR